MVGMQGVEGDAGRDENGRTTKTASGSRTQKSNTSYSLNAANRSAQQQQQQPGTTSNEQFEENTLPQMAVNRQHNLSGTSKRLGRQIN